MKKIKLTIELFFISIVLTACSSKDNNNLNSISELAIEPIIESIVIPEESIDIFENSNIIIDETSILKYRDLINNINPTSKYSLTENDIEEKINNDLNQCYFNFTGTKKDLINMIINNNPELSCETIDIISNAINGIQLTNEEIHRLSSIKIFEVSDYIELEGYSIIEAYYDHYQNAIYLSTKVINEIALDTNSTYIKELEHVLYHEINHARSFTCNCNKLDSINYQKEGYISFIYESVAESDLLNRGIINQVDANYQELILMENELLMLTILSDYTIDDYYDAIFSEDYYKLYKILNLNSIDDIKSFYQILYTIDSNIGYSTNEVDYYNYDYSYKIELFKLLIKSLLDYTNSNQEFSLVENLVLFNIFKSNLINDMYYDYDSNYNKIYDTSMTDYFIELNNIYINYLVEHYQISKEELLKIEDIDVAVIIQLINNYLNGEELSKNIYSEYALMIIDTYPDLLKILSKEIINQTSFENYIGYKYKN